MTPVSVPDWAPAITDRSRKQRVIKYLISAGLLSYISIGLFVMSGERLLPSKIKINIKKKTEVYASVLNVFQNGRSLRSSISGGASSS